MARTASPGQTIQQSGNEDKILGEATAIGNSRGLTSAEIAVGKGLQGRKRGETGIHAWLGPVLIKLDSFRGGQEGLKKKGKKKGASKTLYHYSR